MPPKAESPITKSRAGPGSIGPFKAAILGLPSIWSRYIFIAVMLLLPLMFVSPWVVQKIRISNAEALHRMPYGINKFKIGNSNVRGVWNLVLRISNLFRISYFGFRNSQTEGLWRRCLCVLLAYVMLISPVGFETLARADTVYSQLQTTDWHSGDRTIQYSYDDNGSLAAKTTIETSDPNNVLETVTYEYTLQNRLDSVTVGGTTTTYKYNPDGIRVEKNDNGTITQYVIDSYNHTGYAQVLEEWDTTSTPTLIKTYTIGDDVITQATSTSIEHLLYDGHASTRQTVDNSETLTDAFSYDAYGVLLGNPASTTTNLLYTGEMYDSQSDSYYLRARYYFPSTGTFNRPDPFRGNNQDPQTLHKYLYCHANPVNNIDPSGRFKFALCDIVIAAAIVGMVVGLYLPADTIGERITNSLMMAVLFALFTDIALVAMSAGLVTLWAVFGITLLPAEAYVTLAMIAVGGTTFAAGTENSFFLRQIDRVNKLWRWGYKTPTEQPVEVKLSRQVPENVAYEKRLNRAISKGQPRITTLERGNAVANRTGATKGLPAKEGFHRDEWPMGFTKEGGPGSDVEYIDAHTNTSVGASIGNKLRPYTDGTKFKITFHDGPPG